LNRRFPSLAGFLYTINMLRTLTLAFCLAAACAPSQAGVALGSAHAIVVDEATGEVLLQKDVGTAAPIASLTKLMTAMVVLDAQQDPDERLRISKGDVARGTRVRGVPVGALVSRATLLELALIASDNRAASALARHYPGGFDAFKAAVRSKIQVLGLQDTQIEEPTGLSPNNRSSAQDMVKLLRAAAQYPAIAESTSKRQHAVVVNGRPWIVRNTNRLVGAPGWNILLSKTGFTSAAGRCVSMRLRAAGRTVVVVLMGALGKRQRTHDALSIQRWLASQARAVLPALPVVETETPAAPSADDTDDDA